VPPGQHLLEESGVIEPSASRSPDAAAHRERTRLATLGDRLIAVVLDSAILVCMCAVIEVWAFMKWGIISGAELRVTTASIFVGGSLSFVIAFAYMWLLEAIFGSTLGKVILGIGVVNNSQRSSLAASAIRNLLRLVDGLGFYLIGGLVASCSRFRRRFGDLCAGTYVVEGSTSDVAKILAVLGWLALLTGGTCALPRICAGPKPSHAPPLLGRVVLEMGRSQNLIYLRTPHHSLDLAVVTGSTRETSSPKSAQQPGKTAEAGKTMESSGFTQDKVDF
jgi:uncharacterized RDD family membrane protein YckC